MKINHKAVVMTLLVLVAITNAAQDTESSKPSVEDAKKMPMIPHSSWTCYLPEGIPVPEEGPQIIEFKMPLENTYDIGQTQFGQRQAIVTKEGTITSEKLQGKVDAGGLDYQLTVSNGVIEIEQIFVIRTSDNKFIYARNAGTGMYGDDIRVVMDFEAPIGSSAEWLNKGKYVARRLVDTEEKTLTVTVYDVSEVQIDIDEEKASYEISKPEGIFYQSWEHRVADPSEKQGEQIITEVVALGGSTSVGQSKRGTRNIIPITGGTLSGKINGKVVFGGADYQNFTTPPTIDARYLWQADDGEVIIVRNAGSFGGLVPTFEAKVDGKYAWLNEGTYLSSNPGMGAGGVSLTMYKSSKPE